MDRWWIKEGGHRCKMVGVILLFIFVAIDAEETFAFEKVPGLA
jgi:hypothetical protein